MFEGVDLDNSAKDFLDKVKRLEDEVLYLRSENTQLQFKVCSLEDEKTLLESEAEKLRCRLDMEHMKNV